MTRIIFLIKFIKIITLLKWHADINYLLVNKDAHNSPYYGNTKISKVLSRILESNKLHEEKNKDLCSNAIISTEYDMLLNKV